MLIDDFTKRRNYMYIYNRTGLIIEITFTIGSSCALRVAWWHTDYPVREEIREHGNVDGISKTEVHTDSMTSFQRNDPIKKWRSLPDWENWLRRFTRLPDGAGRVLADDAVPFVSHRAPHSGTAASNWRHRAGFRQSSVETFVCEFGYGTEAWGVLARAAAGRRRPRSVWSDDRSRWTAFHERSR